MSELATTVYRRLVRAPGERADRSTDETGPEVVHNGLRILTATTLQSGADQLVNAKTVLPWLLASLGAPAALVGLLVPIRESGSMLPQAELAGWFRRRAHRAPIWAAGAAGQAVAAAAMTVVALTLHGLAAGIGILIALAVLAAARSLTSLAGKDVLGRTVPKGQRGQLTGTASAAAGVIAVGVGLTLRLAGGAQVGVTALVVLLAVAAVAWVVAGGVFWLSCRVRGSLVGWVSARTPLLLGFWAVEGPEPVSRERRAQQQGMGRGVRGRGVDGDRGDGGRGGHRVDRGEGSAAARGQGPVRGVPATLPAL